MSIITPVLHHNGHCGEAIELYKRAFGASVSVLVRYSDADTRDYDEKLIEKRQDMIYHSELMIGNQRIMMADEFDIEYIVGTASFLTVTFDTDDEVRKAYEVLTEDGTVIYPLRSTTYSSCMASVVDKFGFRWGLMTETA